jgi:hypothetical protein
LHAHLWNESQYPLLFTGRYRGTFTISYVAANNIISCANTKSSIIHCRFYRL